MARYAGGPWKLKLQNGYLSITDANGCDVIVDYDINEDPEVGIFCDAETEVANFILMTEAPALLKALKEALVQYEDMTFVSAQVMQAQAAIARAERSLP